MTSAQSAAYVFSQSVAALAEIAGMHATNTSNAITHNRPVFYATDFIAVIKKYGIGHDAVLRIFEEAGP